MSSIVRNVLAIFAGCVVGLAVIMVAQFINTSLHPLPSGADPSTPEGMAQIVGAMPSSAFVGLIVGYLLGTTVGAFVGVKLAGSMHVLVACVVAAIFVAGGVSNFVMIPHPPWVFATSMVAFVVAPFIALRLARRMPTAGLGL